MENETKKEKTTSEHKVTSPNTTEVKDIAFSIKNSITVRDNMSNRHNEELERIVKNFSTEEWSVVARAMPTEVLATEVSCRLIDLTSDVTAYFELTERIKGFHKWKAQ